MGATLSAQGAGEALQAALERSPGAELNSPEREAALLELFFEADVRLRDSEELDAALATAYMLVGALAASSEEWFPDLGTPEEVGALVLESLQTAYRERMAETALSYSSNAALLLHGSGWTSECHQVLSSTLELIPWTTGTSAELLGLAANVAEDEGEWQQAAQILTELEQRLASEGSTASERGKLLLFRGRHALGLGLYDLASQLLTEAEKTLAVEGTRSGHLLIMLGDLWLESESFVPLRSSHAKWKEELPELMAKTSRPGPILALQDALAASELAREGVAEPAEALLRGCEALDLAPPQRLLSRVALADLYLRENRLDACKEVLDACRKLEIPAESASADELHVIELRARLAEDAGAEIPEPLSQAIHASANRLLDEWSRSARRRGGIGFLRSARRRQVLSAAIEVTLKNGGTPEAALDWVLRGQSLGGLAKRMGATSSPSLKELRAELLADEQAIVVILPGKLEGESHVFAFDHERLGHARISSRDRLRIMAEEIERTLAGLSGQQVSERVEQFANAKLLREGRRLADELFPRDSDVRTIVEEARRLVFVGAESIAAFPPEALVVDGERQLGVSHAVSSAASLSVQLSLARKSVPAEAPGSLFLVAGLRVPSEPSRRFGVVDHVLAPEDLARLTEPFGDASKVLATNELSREGLIASRDELNAASIVHFLVHGVRVEGLERSAALLLAPSAAGKYDLLTCDVLEGELRPSGLVILSACSTADGPLRLGDDNWANLGGAFLRAGARTVVLSRNELELSSTVDLMARFHMHLASGVPTDEALRRAREERAKEGLGLQSLLDVRVQVLGLSH